MKKMERTDTSIGQHDTENPLVSSERADKGLVTPFAAVEEAEEPVCNWGNVGRVLPGYKRFEQKYDMYNRPYWDPVMKPLKVFYDGFRMNKARIRGGGHSQESFALRNAGWHVSLMALAAGDYAGHVDPFNWSRPGCSEKIEINDPHKLTHIIKRAARFLGASDVGIAKVDSRWVYSHRFRRQSLHSEPLKLPENLKYVIVLLTEMDYEAVKTYPSALAGAASGLGYSHEAFISTSLAQFIANLGYHALASMNDTALGIPMAIDAGLGQLGRNGLLISPHFGPRVRICKVFTDLPLAIDKPIDFGLARFCEVCMKCAHDCPSKSISNGPPTTEAPTISNNSRVVKWYVNAEKCLEFWAKNGSECGNCIRVCPWNKDFSHWWHRAVRWGLTNFKMSHRTVVRMDDVIRYGKKLTAEQWWQDGS